MTLRTLPVLVSLASLISLAPRPGQAAAEGEVALVEDVDGAINAAGVLANVYLSKVACAFYQEHLDAYDAIFVFTTIPQPFFTNIQVGWPVRQLSQGIGSLPTDETEQFCAAQGRLRQAVRMGDLSVLPDDPDDLYTGLPFFALSGVELMGHELGHQWLARVRYDKGDGARRCLMRGFEPSHSGLGEACEGHYENDFNLHWSYYFNSGSLMYGSMIEPLGGGRFRLSYDQPKYSPLDQYLMGLRYPEEVPPMFLVDTGELDGSSSLPVAPGTTQIVEGQRIDISIEDVIRAEGPRVPATEPCHWTAAMIIVHGAGAPPSPEQLAKVEAYRERWESFYAWATDGRGSFDTTLDSRQAPSCTGAVRPDAGGGDAAPGDGGAGPATDAPAAASIEAGRQRDGLDSGGSEDGCSCRVSARSRPGTDGLFGALGLLLLAGVRRRRQRRCLCRPAGRARRQRGRRAVRSASPSPPSR